MARYKCEKVVQGLNGDVIAGASVSVYLSGTNIPARVYLTKDATFGVNTVPQLQTDGGGVFRFWVDSADYDYKQRFRIEIVKDNFSVVVDDVKIVEEDDWLDGIINGNIVVGNANALQGYTAGNFLQVKNVKLFGAVGDGVTDDTAAIQKVFASAKPGDVIYFPSGRYKISSQISVSNLNNITILGDKNSEILADGYNGLHFYFNDCQNITIRNLKLTGGGIDSPYSVGGIFFNLTNNNKNPHHVIEDCLISDITNDGLVIKTPILCNIRNVKCLRVAGRCFSVFRGTSTHFDTCYALTSTQSGFYFDTMTYCTLTSCAAEVNGIGYHFVNSNAIVCNGCGSEDQINRGANYPGIAFVADNSRVVLNGCYARNSAAKHLSEVNGGKLIVIDFRNGDAGIDLVGYNLVANWLYLFAYYNIPGAL